MEWHNQDNKWKLIIFKPLEDNIHESLCRLISISEDKIVKARDMDGLEFTGFLSEFRPANLDDVNSLLI